MTAVREWTVEERILVDAPAERVYAAVSDVRKMGRWSPECRVVWVLTSPLGVGGRFIGFNRKGPWVWFTVCRVTRADPGREFAFLVTSFGLPIAIWGYRFTQSKEGTEVVEYWEDARKGPGARAAELLGLVFTGTRPQDRGRVNRVNMQMTLSRLRTAMEGRLPA